MAFALFERFLSLKREDVFLEPDADIVPSPAFSDALEQLLRHRPLQYVIGEAEFCGLVFRVDENVLIPRPETEELVQWIAKEWQDKSPCILDVGTGSGAIAVSLAKRLPAAGVTALDVSPEALAVASGNARLHGVDAVFLQMDILSEMPPGRYDVIVSNPPYVRDSERALMRRNVLDYEPGTALFVPDADPLLFYRRIAELGMDLLTDGGVLYVEVNEAFGHETAELLMQLGYTGIEIRPDVFGKDRMVKGVLHYTQC